MSYRFEVGTTVLLKDPHPGQDVCWLVAAHESMRGPHHIGARALAAWVEGEAPHLALTPEHEGQALLRAHAEQHRAYGEAHRTEAAVECYVLESARGVLRVEEDGVEEAVIP